jgi:hypothetical protein
MKDKMVWVEENAKFQAIHIFKSESAARRSGRQISVMLYAVAVYQVRHQTFLRSKGECELCATPITESGGHLHEQVHRGKGGEISMENSVFICPTCHAAAHADRNPRFSKKPLDI